MSASTGIAQSSIGLARRKARRARDHISAGDGPLDTAYRAGQSGGRLVGVMLTITIAAAVGFIGTEVTSEIDSSISTTSGSYYDNATDSLASGFADAMGLADIAFLVLIFSVILGALLAFRRRRG